MAEKSVVELMQNPKVMDAISKMKADPSCFSQLTAADPELKQLFAQLQTAMEAKEGEVAAPAPPKSAIFDDEEVSDSEHSGSINNSQLGSEFDEQNGKKSEKSSSDNDDFADP